MYSSPHALSICVGTQKRIKHTSKNVNVAANKAYRLYKSSIFLTRITSQTMVTIYFRKKTKKRSKIFGYIKNYNHLREWIF